MQIVLDESNIGDGGKKGGIAFQSDKSNYRGLLAGLEGITGKKVVDSDAMNVKN